jgi:hypothetical protein
MCLFSSVHLEEAGILRAGPGGPDQQWPTVSSATPGKESESRCSSGNLSNELFFLRAEMLMAPFWVFLFFHKTRPLDIHDCFHFMLRVLQELKVDN